MNTDENNDLIVIDNVSKELVTFDPKLDAEEDYQEVRGNIYDLIEKGKEGLDLALGLVQQTESPRAIEVFSTLLKTLTDTNLQLLELQKRKQDLDGTSGKSSGNNDAPSIGTLNQTAIFAGTTAELGKLLQDMQNK